MESTELAGRASLLMAGPAVGLTGSATVIVLWHRPGDVVGSVLLAVAIGALGTRLVDSRRPSRATVSTPR